MNGVLSHRILALAMRLAPQSRGEWARAMAAELEHADGDQRVAFALGCLWSALFWRLATADGVRAAGRSYLVIASGSLALLAGAFVALGVVEGLSFVIAGLGLFYAGAALATLRTGLRGMVVWCVGGLALNTIGLIAIVALANRLPHPDYAPYLRALAAESYVLVGFFLCVAVFAQWLAGRLERAA